MLQRQRCHYLFYSFRGKPPYFYSIDGQHFSANPNFTNLGVGQYPLIVLDSDQCRWQDTFSIASPDAILVDTEVDYNAALNKFQVVVHVAGGQAPYVIKADSSLVISEDTIFTGEVSGSYIFTIVDSLGCEIQKRWSFLLHLSPK